MSNEELWHKTSQEPITVEIKRRKWRWIGQTLQKPDGAIEKAALKWNPQGVRKRGRPKKTWRKTIEEEAMEVGKTWGEVKEAGYNRTRWRSFTDALCSSGSNRNSKK
jgi:hypothetical protein